MAYFITKAGAFLLDALGRFKMANTSPPPSACCCPPVCPTICGTSIAAGDELIAEFNGFNQPDCCPGLDLNNDSFTLVNTGVCCWAFNFAYSDAAGPGIFDCGNGTPTPPSYASFNVCFYDDYIEAKAYNQDNGNQIIWRKNYSTGSRPVDCKVEALGSYTFYQCFFDETDAHCGFNSGVTVTISAPP